MNINLQSAQVLDESTIIGTYYYQTDYSNPILIKRKDNNIFSVSSPYWDNDTGTFQNGILTWTKMEIGKVFHTHIDYGNGNIWHRDTRKNLLFIGSSHMSEIFKYTPEYKNGIFIEARPNIYEQLKNNLSSANDKCNTNYIPINKLVTSKIGEKHIFNVFNNGDSSSIYGPNNEVWQWPTVKKNDEITLISTTIEHLLRENNWNEKKYDVVLDVQGAELVVLNGFGKDNLKNIEKIQVEVSTEQFYKGGVLFPELNDFFVKNGFELTTPLAGNHCDVIYVRK
jgi:FkbM family methyltransferase